MLTSIRPDNNCEGESGTPSQTYVHVISRRIEGERRFASVPCVQVHTSFDRGASSAGNARFAALYEIKRSFHLPSRGISIADAARACTESCTDELPHARCLARVNRPIVRESCRRHRGHGARRSVSSSENIVSGAVENYLPRVFDINRLKFSRRCPVKCQLINIRNFSSIVTISKFMIKIDQSSYHE